MRSQNWGVFWWLFVLASPFIAAILLIWVAVHFLIKFW